MAGWWSGTHTPTERERERERERGREKERDRERERASEREREREREIESEREVLRRIPETSMKEADTRSESSRKKIREKITDPDRTSAPHEAIRC